MTATSWDEWRAEFRVAFDRAADRAMAEALARERGGSVLEWAVWWQLMALNAQARRELDR